MTDGFKPCPLAVERQTDDICDEVVTTTRIVEKDPWTTEHFGACEACARALDNWEPSDDQIYNGHGVEGGIAYDPEWRK